MDEWTETADVAIIGGGIMGASTAYHLAKRGCSGVVILEKVFQRFYQLQFHFFRKPPHIVMGFNDGSGTAEGGDGFNYIRVKGSLCQEFRPLDFFCFRFENIHENFADNFSLFFRVGHFSQRF